MKTTVSIAAALCAALLLLSYLGALHPLGDSLAVFRLWLAGGLSVIAMALGALALRRWMAAALLLAAVASGPILWGMLPSAPPDAPAEVTVYVKNLGSARADLDGLLQDVADSAPDILLLQEVTRDNAALLQERLGQHPHWHICQFSGWSGMVVASRWPILDTACTAHRSAAVAEIAAPGGPLRVASIHQVWPYPYDQAALLPMLLETLRSDHPRQIVAGDFNMVPWGHSVRQIARATGTHRISPVQTTIRVRHVPLAIDHVLTTGTGTGAVERRPQFGSDHYGLLARIGFP